MANFEPQPKEPVVVETKTGEKPVIKVEPPQAEYEAETRIIRSRQIIWYALLVLEALLFLRFLLKLLGANPLSVFSILINLASLPFVILFAGLFPSSKASQGNVTLEWSTLFAMVVYAILAFLLSVYFRLKKPIGPSEAEKKSEQTIP